MLNYNTQELAVNPPESKECWYDIELEITRSFSGQFYGTEEYAEQQAKEYYSRKFGTHDEESFEIISCEPSEE